MHFKRQVFWLMVLPQTRLPAVMNIAVAVGILVPKYSSGTAPDLHRLPFSTRIYVRIPQKAFNNYLEYTIKKSEAQRRAVRSLNSYKTYGIIEL